MDLSACKGFFVFFVQSSCCFEMTRPQPWLPVSQFCLARALCEAILALSFGATFLPTYQAFNLRPPWCGLMPPKSKLTHTQSPVFQNKPHWRNTNKDIRHTFEKPWEAQAENANDLTKMLVSLCVKLLTVSSSWHVCVAPKAHSGDKGKVQSAKGIWFDAKNAKQRADTLMFLKGGRLPIRAQPSRVFPFVNGHYRLN